jgi:hypothetical protein
MFTGARHLSLSWASWIQPTPSLGHVRLCFPSGLSRFYTKTPSALLLLFHACHMPVPSSLVLIVLVFGDATVSAHKLTFWLQCSAEPHDPFFISRNIRESSGSILLQNACTHLPPHYTVSSPVRPVYESPLPLRISIWNMSVVHKSLVPGRHGGT